MTGGSSRLTERLLAAATIALGGDTTHRTRAACWIARSALEAAVDDLLHHCGLDAGGASMRSRLTCLAIATRDEPALAATADYCWVRLSDACHLHAYELSPTDAEARDLVDQVGWLAGRAVTRAAVS